MTHILKLCGTFSCKNGHFNLAWYLEDIHRCKWPRSKECRTLQCLKWSGVWERSGIARATQLRLEDKDWLWNLQSGGWTLGGCSLSLLLLQARRVNNLYGNVEWYNWLIHGVILYGWNEVFIMVVFVVDFLCVTESLVCLFMLCFQWHLKSSLETWIS